MAQVAFSTPTYVGKRVTWGRGSRAGRELNPMGEREGERIEGREGRERREMRERRERVDREGEK